MVSDEFLYRWGMRVGGIPIWGVRDELSGESILSPHYGTCFVVFLWLKNLRDWSCPVGPLFVGSNYINLFRLGEKRKLVNSINFIMKYRLRLTMKP